MPAMTILQIELSLSQRCQQWAFILQSSDISSKDASNDHSFCTRLMSLPKMQAMTIHFALDWCLSQRCKQWPFILQSSDDVSPKDASNGHSFCNWAMCLPKMQAMTILLFNYLSLPKIQSMTILQSSSLLREDANNDHFVIERSLSQRCKEFAIELSLFPRMWRIPNLCFFFYFFSSSFSRCSWCCCSGGAIGNGLPRRGDVDSLTISRSPLLFPLELP